MSIIALNFIPSVYPITGMIRTYRKQVIFILLLLVSCSVSGQGVSINEIMASNATTVADEDGDYSDWLELYNNGTEVVNLSGYYLSDNPGNPFKWTFPETILMPDSFLVVFASDKDRTSGPHLHTNFKISIEGEPIILSNPEGQMVDYLPNVVLSSDYSFGRIPDGESEMILFEASTPGISNLHGSAHEPLEDSIYFSAEQGFYETALNLALTNLNTESAIYYTFDGSDPTPADFLYTEPIEIEENLSPNNLSTINTTDTTALHPYKWRPPLENIFKGTVIKARAFEDTVPTSPIYTRSYFVHEDINHRYGQLPVISLVTDSLHLFDYHSGIYVFGSNVVNYPDNWWGQGNFFGRGKNWERPANFTFFEGGGSVAFNQDVGLRIHGGSSRSLPLKSLRIYARNQYGKPHIDYAFFPGYEMSEFERILLRQSGNDFETNYIADVLSVLITYDFNFLKQRFRSAVLFINGEFWGLMNVRERIDDHFVEYNTGTDTEHSDYRMVETWVEFPETEDSFNDLMEFVINHDLDLSENYEYISTQIDIDNIIDYYIAKLYIAVYDWPGNNIKMWRSGYDRRWRWIYFDNDEAFQDPAFNAIEHATLENGPFWPNPPVSTVLFRKLLANEQFATQFLSTFEYHLLNTFSADQVNALLDSIINPIEPVMQEHINRWQYPESLDFWREEVEKIRTFAKERPCYMRNHLMQYFNISDSTFAQGVCDNISPPKPVTEPAETHFAIWPVPSYDFLNIRLENQATIKALNILDISGRPVLRPHFTYDENAGHFYVSVSHLSSGTYILEIITEEDRILEKFVHHSR